MGGYTRVHNANIFYCMYCVVILYLLHKLLNSRNSFFPILTHGGLSEFLSCSSVCHLLQCK